MTNEQREYSPLTKKQAFFKNFPFLSRYWKPENIGEVSVKRWQPELLECDGYGWNSGKIEPVYLLDSSGREILRVPKFSVPMYPLLSPLWKTPLLIRIQRLGHRAQSVHYIIYKHHNDWDKGTLIVYKPLTGFANISDWISSLQSEKME